MAPRSFSAFLCQNIIGKRKNFWAPQVHIFFPFLCKICYSNPNCRFCQNNTASASQTVDGIWITYAFSLPPSKRLMGEEENNVFVLAIETLNALYRCIKNSPFRLQSNPRRELSFGSKKKMATFTIRVPRPWFQGTITISSRSSFPTVLPPPLYVLEDPTIVSMTISI